MRAFGAALLAMTMMVSGTVSGAFAAEGMLAPGKPAGIRQADIEAGGVLLVVGIVAVAAVIAVVASTTQGNSTPSTTGTAS
jgi:hypothetical protein